MSVLPVWCRCGGTGWDERTNGPCSNTRLHEKERKQRLRAEIERRAAEAEPPQENQ